MCDWTNGDRIVREDKHSTMATWQEKLHILDGRESE